MMKDQVAAWAMELQSLAQAGLFYGRDAFDRNLETSESRYFSPEELPPLAEEKCSGEQVRMCFAAYGDDNWRVQFD